MRPLELTMTAFGSYAGETRIPFRDLKRGLYLVTGDTGAGKTTIFDAIMFALYGRASGADRDRNVEMLHSDYVSRAVDTVVELRFAQNGRECRVTRRIHFRKKRDGSGEYGESAVDAELLEPDRPAIRGATKVTARCEELLGLNAEQFRKIIMLAQGEFKEFLKADSDKKGEILSKLFDSSPYRWYQKLLCAARDELKKRRDEQRRRLAALMGATFMVPEGLSEEERLLYLPDHPDLPANLAALIAAEAAALEQARRSLDEAQRRVNALNERKGAAEADNGLLAELEAQTARRDRLEAEKDAYARRRAALERAEAGLRQAKPAIEDCARAKAACEEAEAAIRRLEERIEAQTRACAAAQAASAGDEADQRTANELAARIQRIEEQLPLYDELAGYARAQAAAEAAEAEAAAREAHAREDRTHAEAELLDARKQLEALESVDARTMDAQSRADRAAERLDDLDGAQGLRRAVAETQARRKRLSAEREALLQRTRRAAEAADRYNSLYRHFIAGQAGLLAAELRTRVEKTGEATCPVCGSTVCPSLLPRLARIDADTPDKAAVDAAKKAAELREAERGDQQAAVEKLAATLEGEQKRLLERARRWLDGCETWEALSATGVLDRAVAGARTECEAAAEALRARQREQRLRDALKARLPGKEAALRELEAAIADNQKAALSRRAEAEALAARIETRRSQLDHADRVRAEAVRLSLKAQRDELTERVRDHREALQAAQAALDTSRGAMSARQAERTARAAERDAARAQMEAVLAKTGFSGPEAVAAALAPIGGRDGEAWLKAEQRALHDYESDLQNARRQIAELQTRTRGKARVDLAALQAEIGAAEAARDAISGACGRQAALLENHRAVAGNAGEARRALARSDEAWKRIDRLAGMASGIPGDDGRRSFERYVLSAVFLDILEMANRRLNQMSGGRYELVLKTGARRANGAAGLDVDVLDYSTNQQRSSASLSGGEAFFTSLSLALGLSDVVQSHAGGRQLDALFIDEGFGTLSDGYLDKALEILNQLTEGNRLVGIISHVDKLDESIPQKIRVSVGENGSRIEAIC